MQEDNQTRSVNRYVGLIFGALWFVAGALAFARSRQAAFTSSTGTELGGQFTVNGLHALLMIATGLLLVAGALASRLACRRVNLTAGALWLVLDLYALLAGQQRINVLAINDHDADILLLASLALLAVGLVLDLPRTSGTGPKYRTIRYGQGPRSVDLSELPTTQQQSRRQRR